MKNQNDQNLELFASFAIPKIGVVRNHQQIKFNGNTYNVVHYSAEGSRSETTYVLIVKNGSKLTQFIVREDGHISNPHLEDGQFVDTLFIQKKLGFNIQINNASKDSTWKKGRTVSTAVKKTKVEKKTLDNISLSELGEMVSQPKRGRGRPRKPVDPELANKPKRGRGRPRKNPISVFPQDIDLSMLSGVESQPKRGRGRPRKVEAVVVVEDQQVNV